MDGIWHPIAASRDIGERQLYACEVHGIPILVVRLDGDLAAVVNRCSHQQAQLSCGRLRGRAIMCPLHGARFDLATGECIGSGYPSLETLAIREADGEVQVRVTSE